MQCLVHAFEFVIVRWKHAVYIFLGHHIYLIFIKFLPCTGAGLADRQTV